MTAVFLIFALVAGAGLAVYMLKVLAISSHVKAGRASGARSTCVDERELPGVSILKPLKGLDDALFDNLESFCRLDYPAYEIIFALQDRADPAYRVAQKVKEKNPQCAITLHVEHCADGLNPKVNNLIPSYRVANHECILISDSNVRVEPGYLKSIVSDLQQPGVGMVTNLIRGVDARSLWAVFENLHMNSFVIGGVSFLDRFLGHPCVVGKSMLMRRADLDAIGGFEAVKDYLAEDYIMGKRMAKQGLRVVVSGYLIDNVNKRWGMKKFLNRHTRWGKLRRHIGRGLYASELFDNPVFIAAIPTVFMGLNHWTLGLLGAACAVKTTGDMLIGRMLSSGIRPGLYALVPMKDLLIGCLWFVPLVSYSVRWRDNDYMIGRDSLLSPAPAGLAQAPLGRRVTFAIRAMIA